MSLYVHHIPAVVEWSDLSSTPRLPVYLAGPETHSVELILDFIEEQQTATVAMRVMVNLLRREGVYEGGFDYGYGWIYPSNIVSLVQDPAHHLPAGISPVLRGSTTCLRLVLAKPASMVLPSALPPRASRDSQKLLNSLELFAKQTVLTIHVDQRSILCAAAVQRLFELFTNESTKHQQDIYGRGITVSHSTNKGAQDEGRNVESASMPLPHEDDQEAPPPQIRAQASKKRKWTHANTGTTTSNNAELLQHRLQLEALLASQQTQTQKIQTLLEDLGRMEEFKEVVKQECPEDLKDSLENGL